MVEVRARTKKKFRPPMVVGKSGTGKPSYNAGSGQCPSCLRYKSLTKAGYLTNHKVHVPGNPSRVSVKAAIAAAPVCEGAGQRPLTEEVKRPKIESVAPTGWQRHYAEAAAAGKTIKLTQGKRRYYA